MKKIYHVLGMNHKDDYDTPWIKDKVFNKNCKVCYLPTLPPRSPSLSSAALSSFAPGSQCPSPLGL